jgi:GNAT superfamily N-acetyltransferase
MNIPTPSPSNHPPTEARVRRACLADVPAVRALGTEFYRRAKDPDGNLDEAQRAYLDGALARMWDEDYLRHIIADERASFVVADADGPFVGMALAIPKGEDGSTALLSRLCVLPAYREGRLARRLLRRCEVFLPAGVRRLETCAPLCDPLQVRFYEGRGFRRERQFKLGSGAGASEFLALVKSLERTPARRQTAPVRRLRIDYGLN